MLKKRFSTPNVRASRGVTTARSFVAERRSRTVGCTSRANGRIWSRMIGVVSRKNGCVFRSAGASSRANGPQPLERGPELRRPASSSS